MWLVEAYIKYLLGFIVLWSIIWLERNIACSSMTSEQMLPLLRKEDYFTYYPRDRQASDFRREKDLVYYQQATTGLVTAGEFVARVIALPGDTVAIDNGTVILNGQPQPEQYINQQFASHETIPEIIIPRDHIFVLADARGDNRGDSRAFGPIWKHAILGRLRMPGD